MFGRHVRLSDHVIELLYGALSILMHIYTSCTHIETLVRWMSLATAFSGTSVFAGTQNRRVFSIHNECRFSITRRVPDYSLDDSRPL